MVQGKFEAKRTGRVDQGQRRVERRRRRSKVRFGRHFIHLTSSMSLRCSRRVLRSSNLTFSLSPGWAFVETEGWRPDLIASWAVESAGPSASVCVGADEGTFLDYSLAPTLLSNALRLPVFPSVPPSLPTGWIRAHQTYDTDGWTYTTDTWIHPRPDARPCDGWVTRRRRWTRRVYFKGVER